MGYIIAADSMSVFIQIFVVVRSKRRTYFETETECVIAVQGHPRSLISVPIESAYATSYNGNIGPMLPSFRNIAHCLLKQRLHAYSIRIWGCSPWIRLAMLGLRRRARTLS